MYLLKLLSKHKTIVLMILTSIIPTILWIWDFGFQNLLPNTNLSTEALWKIRMGLTILLPSIYLFAFFVILVYDHKKIDIENIKLKEKIKTTEEELITINQKLNEQSQEIAKLKWKTSGIIKPPIKSIVD